jgi:hypothetical protein
MNALFRDTTWVDRVHMDREDSCFGPELGLKFLKLKSACWMNPGAEVCGISPAATSIDIYVYHIILPGFTMNNEVRLHMGTESEK